MDAAAGFPPHNGGWELRNERRWHHLLDRRFTGQIKSYDKLAREALSAISHDYRFFPGVCPQWDNEARKPARGVSFCGSTPEKYGAWLRQASRLAMQAPSTDERIVFINAWNEWAEGAYLEPDRHFGYAYLAETARIFEEITRSTRPSGWLGTAATTHDPAGLEAKRRLRNLVANVARSGLNL